MQNKKINLIVILLFIQLAAACSSIKKYRPDKHTKDKPKAYLKIDGSKTAWSNYVMGFGSHRMSHLHIKQKDKEKDCYHYLGTVSVKRNKSSKNLPIPSDGDIYLKFQRIVEKSGSNYRKIDTTDSFFEFTPVTGKNYSVQYDDKTKGMESIRFLGSKIEDGTPQSVENFFDKANKKKYDNECKG